MESGLTLLGVTALEDRLQDKVEETLECLRVAGIKVSSLHRLCADIDKETLYYPRRILSDIASVVIFAEYLKLL